MRKLMMSATTAIFLVVAGCSTTQVQQIETFIGQVQAATAQACKFVPTVNTIITMVNSGIGQVVGVVTAAICNAIPPPASARFKALPLVNNGAPVTIAPNISGWRTQ